ncbi:MAG: hypothetical protein LH473_03725, partial [Chitinophagales bacterium]|nr:hypothetical protein [Chitinophagales bacterium]
MLKSLFLFAVIILTLAACKNMDGNKESALINSDSSKWIFDTVAIYNVEGEFLRDTVIRYNAKEDSSQLY